MNMYKMVLLPLSLFLSPEETIAKILLITEKASNPLNFTANESANIYIKTKTLRVPEMFSSSKDYKRATNFD